MGAKSFLCGINKSYFLIPHIPQFLRKTFHVTVHLLFHIIVKCKDAAFFQYPQALQQQFLHICTHDIVTDIVADDHIKALIRKIQLLRITVLKYTAGSHALTCSIFLAECLAVIVHSAPIINTDYFCVRSCQSRTDCQRSGAATYFQNLALTVIV